MSSNIWILTPYILSSKSIDVQFDHENQRVFNNFDTVKNAILTVAESYKASGLPYFWAEIKEYTVTFAGEMSLTAYYIIADSADSIQLLAYPCVPRTPPPPIEPSAALLATITNY